MSTVYPVNNAQCVQPHAVCPDCGFIRSRMVSRLTIREATHFSDFIEHRNLIKRKEYLHRAGSAPKWINFLHSGFLKTVVTDNYGREQTVGFRTAGDPVGLEAVGGDKNICNTIALEDSRICGIRYVHFERLARDIPALQRHLHELMSHEIARNLGMTSLLRQMDAETRLAAFLLELAGRIIACGGSGIRFRLPMSRRDIASFLGLKLETISRAFSHFDDLQIIAIRSKEIEIRDIGRLRELAGNRATRRSAPHRDAVIPGIAGAATLA